MRAPRRTYSICSAESRQDDTIRHILGNLWGDEGDLLKEALSLRDLMSGSPISRRDEIRCGTLVYAAGRDTMCPVAVPM